MITLAIILFFIIIPKSRPYILGFIALIAVSLLIGWLMPDFFWEEPAFWVGIIICLFCLAMAFSSLADEEKKEYEKELERRYGRRKD